MTQQDGRTGATGRMPALAALAGGIAAALVAGAAMGTLREMLGVRTVPERVMEALLLVIPPGLFEALLLGLGGDAKRYALYLGVAIMLVALAAIGALLLRRRRPPRELAGVGVALWLLTMVVIMPLTGAGLFAAALIDGKWPTVGGYLAIGLTYVAVLAVARAMSPRASGEPRRGAHGAPVSRRGTAVLLGAAVAAWGATYLAVGLTPRSRTGTRVVVLDPQEPVASGGFDPPRPHPSFVPVTPTSGRASTTAAASSVADSPTEAATRQESPVAAGRPEPEREAVRPTVEPTRTPTTTSAGEPAEPPSSRPIARDKDGAVLPSPRPSGEPAEFLTTNEDFYVVSKNAAGDPSPRAAEWRVSVDGDVRRPIDLDYRSLRNLPAVEATVTLECISNFVDQCELAPFGCGLISTARWRGVRLSDVLDLAGGLEPDVVSVATFSADEFTTSLPIEVALDPGTLLVYEMNGQVLPREHGYPARVLVPGRYGMKSAKWVVGFRPLRRAPIDWYGQRGWSKEAIVKTMTRIDVPTRGAELPPGEHDVAGIAYAGNRGILKVELSEDGGQTWQAADVLEPVPGRETWVRWQSRFVLAPGGELTLVARATDGSGAIQAEEFSLPQPDGSSGWHHLSVKATPA